MPVEFNIMDLPLMEFEYENDCAMFTLSSFSICLNRITLHCDDNAINSDPITIMTSSCPVWSILSSLQCSLLWNITRNALFEASWCSHPSQVLNIWGRAVWRCSSGEYDEAEWYSYNVFTVYSTCLAYYSSTMNIIKMTKKILNLW